MNNTGVCQVRFVWSPASQLPELAKSHVLQIRDALHFQGTGPIPRATLLSTAHVISEITKQADQKMKKLLRVLHSFSPQVY